MRRTKHIIGFYVGLIYFFNAALFCQQKISIEFFSGIPINVPLPLTINQQNEKELSFTARYNSEPFVVPIYWNWRISLWSNDNAWEIESTHMKIILSNKPAEIQQFQISHGLNFVNINRVWKFNGFDLRAGAGCILAHPENIIRNKQLSEDGGIFSWGYYLSGPVFNFAAGKRFNFSEFTYMVFEAKLNASYAAVPVAYGNANVYNIALQLNFGVGMNILL